MKKIWVISVSALVVGLLFLITPNSYMKKKSKRYSFTYSKPEMKIRMPGLYPGERIHKEYSCDGENESPALEFSGIPKEAKSLVLIMENPGSPEAQKRHEKAWVHWLVFNIPATVTELKHDANIEELGGIIGKNSWDENKYDGPCPLPTAGTQIYFFKLYALDSMLDLDEKADAVDVRKAMENHILTEEPAKLTGTFSTEVR